MSLKVTHNFFLDSCFQHHQQYAETGLDVNIFLTHHDDAVDTWAGKVNFVIFPAVVDTEFPGQVCRQIIRRLLSVLFAHRVMGEHIYDRHRQYHLLGNRASLDVPGIIGQRKQEARNAA